jgi:pimeloyl-ACP methyl ester carboxylesterase
VASVTKRHSADVSRRGAGGTRASRYESASIPSSNRFRPVRAIVERTLGTLERYRVTDAAREDYIASFEGDRFAESMRYVQSYPTELEALRDVLPHIQTPVQIISGRRDAVVPLVNAEYLHDRSPCSELRVIDAGPFVWEDAADDYAALVNQWWADGFKTCPKTSTASAAGSRAPHAAMDPDRQRPA